VKEKENMLPMMRNDYDRWIRNSQCSSNGRQN